MFLGQQREDVKDAVEDAESFHAAAGPFVEEGVPVHQTGDDQRDDHDKRFGEQAEVRRFGGTFGFGGSGRLAGFLFGASFCADGADVVEHQRAAVGAFLALIAGFNAAFRTDRALVLGAAVVARGGESLSPAVGAFRYLVFVAGPAVNTDFHVTTS